MAQTTSFNLNGKAVRVTADPGRMLVWVLRHNLGLTGTKVGCGAGLCGACTVLVDMEPTLSCSTPLAAVAGKSVLTIEGVAANGKLDIIQESMINHAAVQCGYCTPGMILGAYALLKKKPRATRAEIMDQMEGHLCRCGSHMRILDAVEAAGREMGGVL